MTAEGELKNLRLTLAWIDDLLRDVAYGARMLRNAPLVSCAVVVTLTIGIGLDTGEAVPMGAGYRGTALNVAARLCAKATAGQVLATETVILPGAFMGRRFARKRVSLRCPAAACQREWAALAAQPAFLAEKQQLAGLLKQTRSAK